MKKGIVSINIREFVKGAGEFTLNFIPIYCY